MRNFKCEFGFVVIVLLCSVMVLNIHAEDAPTAVSEVNPLDVMAPFCDMSFIGSALLIQAPKVDAESGELVAEFKVTEALKGPMGALKILIPLQMREHPTSGLLQTPSRDLTWNTGQIYHLYCIGDQYNIKLLTVMTPQDWSKFNEMLASFSPDDLLRAQVEKKLSEELAINRKLLLQEYKADKLTREEYDEKIRILREEFMNKTVKRSPPIVHY